MDEQKFEKTLKDVKWSSVIILVLALLGFLRVFLEEAPITTLIISVIQIALILGTIIGCHKKVMYGPICGVVVAILMFLSFSLFDIIIGIFLLIECINLIRHMNN